MPPPSRRVCRDAEGLPKPPLYNIIQGERIQLHTLENQTLWSKPEERGSLWSPQRA